MVINYPECGDFCEVASEIWGVTPEQIERLSNVGLCFLCARRAPQSGFGDTDVYPTLLEKVAVLLEPSEPLAAFLSSYLSWVFDGSDGSSCSEIRR